MYIIYYLKCSKSISIGPRNKRTQNGTDADDSENRRNSGNIFKLINEIHKEYEKGNQVPILLFIFLLEQKQMRENSPEKDFKIDSPMKKIKEEPHQKKKVIA